MPDRVSGARDTMSTPLAHWSRAMHKATANRRRPAMLFRRIRRIAKTVALIVGLAACEAPPTVLMPQYRFVDPGLREGAEAELPTLSSLDAERRERRAGSAAHIPLATIQDDTRYVLQGWQSRVLVSQHSVEVPPGGRFTYTADVSDAFADSDRLALLPFVRLSGSWKSLPGIAADVEYRDGRRIVRIPIALPEPSEARETGLFVDAYAIPSLSQTAYRTPAVVVPEGAMLEVALGILQVAWGHGSVLFSISTCEGEVCWPLHVETVDPARKSDRAWLDRRLSLASLTGKRRAFLFETRHADKAPHAFTLPVWGNPTVVAPAQSALPGPNILLISLDTLGAKHLSTYGYERKTSPFIDSGIAPAATLFENFIAAATNTVPSHMTMFTSLAPSVHGVTEQKATLPAAVPTLAQILRAHGYETAAVTENVALTIRGGFGRGFNEYRENKSEKLDSREGLIRDTFALGEEWMARNRGKRFFLFLHTYKVHAPYLPPKQYEGFFEEPNEAQAARRPDWIRWARMKTQYDREIRFVDDELKALFERLDQQGPLKDTVVVILSDHGEEFFEHGSQGHGGGLYREVLQVPLLMVGADIPAGRRIGTAVRHVDLMPSLLELAGAPSPRQMQGKSFFPLLAGDRWSLTAPEPIFCSSWGARSLQRISAKPPSFSIQRDGQKLIRYLTEDGYRYEYYDLTSDPWEEHDLYAEREGQAHRLESELDSYIRTNEELHAEIASGDPSAISSASSESDLRPQLEEKLRALGYLE